MTEEYALVAKKSDNNALNDVVSLRVQAVVVSTHEVELLSNASAASSQIAMATT